MDVSERIKDRTRFHGIIPSMLFCADYQLKSRVDSPVPRNHSSGNKSEVKKKEREKRRREKMENSLDRSLSVENSDSIPARPTFGRVFLTPVSIVSRD